MARVLVVLLVVILVLAVAAGVFFYRLQPPVLLVAARSQAVVFENVTVVEPGLSRAPGRRVEVEDGRITRIGAAEPGTEPEGFLLPGLIDMHVHAADAQLDGQQDLFRLLYLAHGVTAVRNTGGSGAELAERGAVARGEIAGPRVFACGPLVDGEPPVWSFSATLSDPAGAEALVANHKAGGFDCLKVYEMLEPDVLAALVAAARKHDLTVVGHVPQRVRFEDAHIQDVQHLFGSAREAGREPLPDMAQNVAARTLDWAVLSPERIDFVVETSRTQGIAHTPTLTLRERGGQMDRLEELKQAPEILWLPRFYADITWDPRGMPWYDDAPPAIWAQARRGAANAKRLTGALFRAGVRIHAGTDVGNSFLVPGASLHEELRHLEDAGLTPEEVWVTATRWPGEFLGEPGLGRIAPGAPADLLLFAKDPSRDLANLSTLEVVVAAGRVYPRALLDAALEKARGFYRGDFYEAVSMAIGQRMRDAFIASLDPQTEQPTP